MAEREVVLKISAKAAPGAGDGFKKIAQGADAAKAATDKLDNGFRKVASGVAGLGAIALSADKDVKKLLETFIAFRSLIDIFQGIQAAIIGASAALKGFGAAAAVGAAGGRAGGVGAGLAGGAAAGVAGKAAGGLGAGGAGLIAAPLALGAGALAAFAFPDATVDLLRNVGLFGGLKEDEKRIAAGEKRQQFIQEQRENIEANAKKLFDLQEKLNAAVRDETKARIDALKAQQEQLKVQQEQAKEFALLDPFQQIAARNVARALSEGRGGRLSAEELRFAGGLSALRPAVDQFLQQRGAESPILQEIQRLRPQPQDLIQRDIEALEQRAKESERAIQAQVNQAIQVEITQNPESLATQIARSLLPQLVELNQRTIASLEKQIKDVLGNLRAGQRASFGIAKPP